MKFYQKLGLVLLACAFGLSRTHAAVSVSFDGADSSLGAGLYDFILSGAPASATIANYNSAFTLTGWSAPAIGNDVTLVSTRAPSAWNLTENDPNNAKWILESTSSPYNEVDGRFEVQGKANLQGVLTWQFSWPGDNSYSGSGLVTISAIPEPAIYSALSATGLLALVIGWGLRAAKGR